MPDSADYALLRPELTASLSQGESLMIRLMSEARRYRSGTFLARANEPHDWVYRIKSGWVCRKRSLSDGRDQVILIFLPGDFFAIKSMFTMHHTDDLVVMTEDAEIEQIERRTLHQVFKEEPDIANRCIWQVIEEERRLHNWVVGLGQGSAEERLASFLIDVHGRLNSFLIKLDDTRHFELPLTQGQIADYLGITAVHVNRVLRTFRDDRVADIRGGEAHIFDLPKLRAIAQPILDLHERKSANYK